MCVTQLVFSQEYLLIVYYPHTSILSSTLLNTFASRYSGTFCGCYSLSPQNTRRRTRIEIADRDAILGGQIFPIIDTFVLICQLQPPNYLYFTNGYFVIAPNTDSAEFFAANIPVHCKYLLANNIS